MIWITYFLSAIQITIWNMDFLFFNSNVNNGHIISQTIQIKDFSVFTIEYNQPTQNNQFSSWLELQTVQWSVYHTGLLFKSSLYKSGKGALINDVMQRGKWEGVLWQQSIRLRGSNIFKICVTSFMNTP